MKQNQWAVIKLRHLDAQGKAKETWNRRVNNGQLCDPMENPNSRMILLKRPKIIYVRDNETDKEKWKW